MTNNMRRKVVHMTELHRQLGQFIRKVARSDEHFVVEKGGLPVAVMMSVEEYERLTRDQRRREFARHARAIGEEVARQGLTEEQVDTLAEEVRERLHRERYGGAG